MPRGFHNFLNRQHHEHPVRRAIWKTLARVGATGMHALPVSRHWVEIHERPMPLAGLHPQLASLRIVQISDIHYSPVVWKQYLEQYFDLINDLHPDLIVITGDLITGGYFYAKRVAQVLMKLKAPLGVVCTFGNHDYSMWGKRPGQAQKRGDYLERELEEDGLIVLRNELLVISPSRTSRQIHRGEPRTAITPGELIFVGLDDEWTGSIDPDAGFESLTPNHAVVCLNHNPANARELLPYPWQWMLSGHTHGRQIGHKGLSKALLGKHYRHFTHGYYAVEGRHLYVNRGLSYGQRAHDWCRPEVTVFTTNALTDT
jgi:predicted MPP superfamily phosphohydrolase